MTAPQFNPKPSRLEWALFGVRVLTLVLIVGTFMPPVFAQHTSVETELAVSTQRLNELEKSTAVVIQQYALMAERVSRIEGIGIGLGLLTAVQLFLQVTNTITLKRKGQ